jgi:phosphatidylserine/phosphatidylglycerophosphate/cardiolipin synthase-like enzyme
MRTWCVESLHLFPLGLDLADNPQKFNPEHRHDEEHEKACDEKRTKICEEHRFKSYFPERDGNLVKWYVDGRDYFWVS